MTAPIFLRCRPLASVTTADLAALQTLLSPAEQAALPARPDSRRYRIAARGLLRQWLGEILDCDPRDLEFRYGDEGKPALARHSLQFNLTHSRQHLALAWTFAPVALGLDIEDLGQRPRAARLQDVLSPAEQALLTQSAAPEALFLAFWTRKEALLKARGQGISRPLQTVDTAPLERQHLRHQDEDFFLATWQEQDHVVSLAAQGSGTPEPRWLPTA